jgi:alpha-L-rhamnosidase
MARQAMGPAPLLRRTFRITKPVAWARLYASALGLYEPHLNGGKVGEDLFTPGWTDYNKRVQYQTFDVTARLRQGENTLGLILGDGWYAGYIGWFNERGLYGPFPMARVQLQVRYEDGSRDLIVSDRTWQGAHGPIRYSDFLKGEHYDARREIAGWDAPRIRDDGGWSPVTEMPAPAAALVAQQGPQARRTEEIRPLSITESRPGRFVFDLGLNMVGWARLAVRGAAGTRVRMRFAEILNPDGTLYTVNLRSARSIDTYVLKGCGLEAYEPRFTFHGFRYIELSGYPGRPSWTSSRAWLCTH